jgi:hypothetical protein
MCGAFTKYLHEMLHPVDLKVLVGCTCHAQLLGIPYADAEQHERNLKKEEKIALRLAKQKDKEEAHELEVVNGGMCSEGLRCPKCRQRVEKEKRAAIAAAEELRLRLRREEHTTILLRAIAAAEELRLRLAIKGGGCGKYTGFKEGAICGIDGNVCGPCWGKKNGGCGTYFKDPTCWYSSQLCGGKTLCPNCKEAKRRVEKNIQKGEQ